MCTTTKIMLTTEALIRRVEDPRVLLDSLLSKALLPLPQKGKWYEENHRRAACKPIGQPNCGERERRHGISALQSEFNGPFRERTRGS